MRHNEHRIDFINFKVKCKDYNTRNGRHIRERKDLYRVAPQNGTVDFFVDLQDFALINSYLYVIGFAISLSLIVPRNSGNRANPENYSPSEITHKIKSYQPYLMILMLL